VTATGSLAAIVLAGGRSARFGRDKLAEPFAGRPLLDHAIAVVLGLTNDVVVVVAPGAVVAVPSGVRLVHDERAFEGPLAGAVAGLAATDADVALIVAGDSPTVVPGVLGLLVSAVTAGAEAARLEVGDDRPPLPMAVGRSVASERATTLLAQGERRLRALPEALDAATVPELVWRQEDPAGATLLDIDTPTDLP
jgi:molybdopterin-guanine dinucleotide biosynthesis protein A